MRTPARILVAVGIALFTAALPARAVLPAVTAATTESAAAASTAAASTAAEVEVKIDNFTFAPQRIVVKAGTKVTWINEDDIPHTVMSSGKLFKSKTLDTSDAFTFTFTTPGDYAYFCSLHPHMTGTIVVEAETGGVIP
jgi:plastocyanin